MKSNLNTRSICLTMAVSTTLIGQSIASNREISETMEIKRSQI